MLLSFLSTKVKQLDCISAALILSAVFVSIFLIKNYFDTQIATLQTEVLLYSDAYKTLRKKVSKPRYPFATQYDKVDYHNYKFMDFESLRYGNGEQGRPFILRDVEMFQRNQEIFEKFGFYGIASDHISVNRSLPDVRHEK